MWELPSLPELPVFGLASNTVVCGWFLALFTLVFAGVVLGGFVVFTKMVKSPVSLTAKVTALVGVTLAYALALATPGFQYTMCKRALF